jgi:acetoin utilization deacetylase AcuC-like enzyme
MPLPLIYHDAYDLNLGEHVFPSRKYRLIKEKLARKTLPPRRAADDDIAMVHTRSWLEGMRDGTLSRAQIMKLEIPWTRQTADAFWLAAGGTILAAEKALEHGGAYNISGGFHHAFPNHGEGFCAIHDVAVAIRSLQKRGLIAKAMTIDTDVHHGNGTAAIFADDPTVFTFSIHQFNNYPFEKPPSDLDVHLPDGVEDEAYLAKLRAGVEECFARHTPDMLFYVAGADPYKEDLLGGLRLTLDGLRRRDELVLQEAVRRKVPFVVTLAGGYARKVEDTVTIHANTALAAEAALGKG